METTTKRFWLGFLLGIPAGGAILIGVVMVVAFVAIRTSMTPLEFPDPAAVTPIGAADYAWPLSRVDGEAVSFEAFRGKTVFLNYWATWCGPCRRELPSIAALAKDYPPGGPVEIVLVSHEAPEEVAAFLEREKYDLHAQAFVSTDDPPKPFAGESVPRTYVIRPDGAIVLKHRGAENWNTEECRGFLEALAR